MKHSQTVAQLAVSQNSKADILVKTLFMLIKYNKTRIIK